MAKVKKYALVNSYFKIARNSYGRLPTDMLDIAKTFAETGELPFEYSGGNWLYDAFVEKQKREQVIADQFFTPDRTAERVAELSAMQFGSELVVDACAGFGQIGKALLRNCMKVEAFELDYELAEICNLTGLPATQSDFRDYVPRSKFLVSNPPFKDLPEFLQWTHKYFETAILILPVGYVDKDKPKALVQTLSKFYIIHRERMTESFARTGISCEIVIMERMES